MLFTLEIVPAHEGDCLMLHWGTAADPKHALIDGGPGDVYDKKLLPRINQIRANRGLNTPLKLSLVMVSHIDNDHITGVKKLFAGMEALVGGSPKKSPVLVDRLWHNTFNDILDDDIDQYYKQVTASFTASVDGEPNPQIERKVQSAFVAKGEPQPEAEFQARVVSEILAGQPDGRDLRNSFEVLKAANWIKYSLNAPFTKAGKGTLIKVDKTPMSTDIEGLQLAIYGPMLAEIEALQAAFDQYIKSKGLNVEAVLAAYADKSVPNLSSIVCYVGMKDGTGQPRTILLTGDARGDKIIESLRNTKTLTGASMHVTILKLPHHGSNRNLAPDFFTTITADHYVISADGKYGNPDCDTLKWLVEARGKSAVYDIYLTYKPKGIDAKHKAEVESKGKAWDEKTMSIELFFKSAVTQGYKFRYHQGDVLKIDLGDETLPW